MDEDTVQVDRYTQPDTLRTRHWMKHRSDKLQYFHSNNRIRGDIPTGIPNRIEINLYPKYFPYLKYQLIYQLMLSYAMFASHLLTDLYILFNTFMKFITLIRQFSSQSTLSVDCWFSNRHRLCRIACQMPMGLAWPCQWNSLSIWLKNSNFETIQIALFVKFIDTR